MNHSFCLAKAAKYVAQGLMFEFLFQSFLYGLDRPLQHPRCARRQLEHILVLAGIQSCGFSHNVYPQGWMGELGTYRIRYCCSPCSLYVVDVRKALASLRGYSAGHSTRKIALETALLFDCFTLHQQLEYQNGGNQDFPQLTSRGSIRWSLRRR